MAIVTTEEVISSLGVVGANVEPTQLLGLIDLVQGEMESILNLVEPTLVLKQTPILSVEEVKADGVVVATGLYTVTSWGLDFAGYNSVAFSDPVVWTPSDAQFLQWQTPDIALLARGVYPQGMWSVTYRAGLDGANIPALKSVLIRALRRELYEMNSGVSGIYTSMKVEDYSWAKNERLIMQMRGSFTPGEVRIMDQYIRKQIS